MNYTMHSINTECAQQTERGVKMQLQLKVKILLEDGRVYIKPDDVNEMESTLEEMNIKYFVIPINSYMTMIELNIEEM